MAEVDEQTGLSLEGFETEIHPRVDADTGINLEGFETAPEAVPISNITGVDEDKLNNSLKFSQELNIPPSQAFDMHDSIVNQKKERQKIESLKHESLKVALRGESNALTSETKSIMDGMVVDPFGIRGLVESSLAVGAGVTSWLASFPVGIGTMINQVVTRGEFNFGDVRLAMEGIQELPGEFESLQPKTVSGQQWANIVSFPFQVYHERGVEPMAEWAAETFGGTDENKEDIRGVVKIMGDAGLLIAPAAVKKGKTKVFNSDFYRQATIKERGLVVLDYETLRKQGYTEAELARMSPEFFERALNKRKATLVDEELAKVEGKPVERVVLERERAELEPSKEPSAVERVAEIDKEIKGIVEPISEEFLHGTTSKAAKQILETGKFTTKGVERLYPYSEFGADAVYFAKRGTDWFLKDPGARNVRYETTVLSKLAPDANIYKINTMEDADKLARLVGLKSSGELSTKITVDPVDLSGVIDRRIILENAESQEVIEKISDLGFDGIEVTVAEGTNFTGPQLVIFNLDKITPVSEVSIGEASLLEGEVTTPEQRQLGQVAEDIVRQQTPIELSAKDIDAIIEGKAELTEAFEVKPVEIPRDVKETKNLKKRVRLLTGQRKISDLVTEESALKERFKKAQRESRKAFREGSKEGVAKENLRLKELATRSKFRKEASSEVRKMIKNLKKVQKDLDKFHPSFKEPVNELLEGIDLVRLGGKKKIRLQSLSSLIERDFVNEVELSDNTIGQLKRLDKFNVGDMTFEDLSDIHDVIMHLTHLNKLKNEIIVKQKNRKFNEVLNETVAEMKPPKEVAKGIISSQPGAFKKTREVGRLIKDTFGIRHDAYDLIIESIAGLNSTIEQVLFQAVDAGTDVQILHKKNTYNKFQSDLEGFSERHGIDDIANWLNEPVTVDNFRFTRNERMELFNHSLNEDNRTAIVEGGFGLRTSDSPDVIYSMTEAELVEIINSLTPAEREFSGQPVRNLFADQREALNEVFLKRNNYAMPDIENYYPKDVMPIGRKIDDTFLESQTALEALKGQYTRVGINKDHLRPRVGSTAPLYINGMTNTINKSIVHSAAYIGLEIPMANASKLLYNKQFRNEIVTRYDRITWLEIEKGLRDIAGDYKSYSTVETLLLRAKNNVATAFLGLNPFVMAKQIISLPLYGTYVKGDFLVQGAMDYMNNTAEIKARHSLYSPKWFERTEGGFSRDVADVFKSGGEKRLFKGKKTIQESTMKGIQLFDESAVGPGMQGAVLQVISEFQAGKLSPEVRQAINIKDSEIKNLTPEEKMVLAYKFADFATVRTQPMFSPAHRSSLQRGTPLEVLATMFGSFTNRALNLLRRTYRESKREKSPEANAKFARALFTVMVINSLAVTAIDSVRDKMRGREVSIESVLTRILTSWTGYFFFLRDISSAISSSLISGNRYSGFDVQLPVQRPVNMTKDVALEGIDLIQALADNDMRKAEEAALRFIDDGIGLALMTKGIPYETPKRFVQDLAGFNKKDKKVTRPKIKRR